MFREGDICNLKVEDPCEIDPDYLPDKKVFKANELDVSVLIIIFKFL